MQPLTTLMPKPLLPVAGKPFMEHTIEVLRDAGITEITILLGWLQNRVIRHFGDGRDFGVKINYLKQEERRGTAHAIGMAKNMFKDEFLTLHGNVVLSHDMLKQLLDCKATHEGNIVAVTKVDQPENYGVVTLEDGKITGIIEKPRDPSSYLANAGIYIFTPEIFEAIRKTPVSKRGEYEISDTLQILLEDNQIHGCELQDSWLSIGMPWDMLTANELIMGAKSEEEQIIEGEVEPLVTMKGFVKIGKGSIVKNGVYIEGPVIIGENSVVGPNCYLKNNVVVGNNCNIGCNVMIENSIIMKDSDIPYNNYVGDSIIGENCNLGAGTKVANIRLNDKKIEVFLRGKKIDTGRRRLGVIMGHNVKTGINSVIDVGTVIGENAFIGPGTKIRGTVKPNSMIL